MHILIDSLLLIFLFALLGFGADFTVKNIQYLVSVLKVRLFAFGILLGIITTLPELFLGINATIEESATLSIGNLLSGPIVMLGLILGTSLILNRQILTDGKLSILIPQVALILLPILLGLDGNYQTWDGLLMIISYAMLIYYLYKKNHSYNFPCLELLNKNKINKAILFSIGGIISVLIVSHWIIEFTLDLIKYINIDKLIIGSLVFGIGTNLPEIIVTITSWRKKASELSLSHLLSSSFTNTLVLGLLVTMNPIKFSVEYSFVILSIFLVLIIALFLFFYRSGKRMSNQEGFIMLMTYVLFLMMNFYFIRQV